MEHRPNYDWPGKAGVPKETPSDVTTNPTLTALSVEPDLRVEMPASLSERHTLRKESSVCSVRSRTWRISFPLYAENRGD
jgi:hypothetical protein